MGIAGQRNAGCRGDGGGGEVKGETLRTLELCGTLSAITESLTPNLDDADCETDGKQGSDADGCGYGTGDGTDLLPVVLRAEEDEPR